jgi:hypothetical protein
MPQYENWQGISKQVKLHERQREDPCFEVEKRRKQ